MLLNVHENRNHSSLTTPSPITSSFAVPVVPNPSSISRHHAPGGFGGLNGRAQRREALGGIQALHHVVLGDHREALRPNGAGIDAGVR